MPVVADRQYSGDEDVRRYAVFVEQLQKMEAHNREFLAKRTSFSMGIGPFTDQVCLSTRCWLSDRENTVF